MVHMHVAQLLFVASVDESRKLVCQAPGCGRAIAKAVHVIRDSTGTIRVIGSGCYGRLSGHEEATRHGATIAGFDGRRLTPEERALMIADTAAFIADVEARLAAEREAKSLAADRISAEAQRLRERATGSIDRHPQPASQWQSPLSDGTERMFARDRTRARDSLAQFRAQQARQAARIAMQRRPELSTFSVDVVADALVQAKADYVPTGHRMDAPDARSVIEAGAIAVLSARGSKHSDR